MKRLEKEMLSKLHFAEQLISGANPNSQFYFSSSRVLLASYFSTAIQKTQPTLYDRIKIIRDPRKSVVPVLDQWVSEGNTVKKSLLQSLVRLMKDHKRYKHALEISHWMTDRRYLEISPSDAAVRLDLIHRVHGTQHAENYFDKLSAYVRTYSVYGALLSVYVRENSVQKAEAIMQEMKEKGMAKSPFPYNVMVNLYRQTENFEKINTLMEEMEGNGIPQDTYTLSNLMTAYATASNISGMENILTQLEKDPRLDHRWCIYSTAASGYLKVGLIEKALTMIKKVEKKMPLGKRSSAFNFLTSAFNFLLNLYADAGKKDEVYRVWNEYKPLVEVKEADYCCMITSLTKLDDIEGAEKIFEEWESRCTFYNFRVLNRLLVAYCKKGLLEKAEAALETAAKGRTPYASTWNVMAMGYIGQNKMSKAVEMVKRAISVSRKGWRPNPLTLTACLDYLKEQGDVKGMEEIIKSLKTTEPLTKDIYIID